MSENTYERKDTGNIYETYEWDSVWMEYISNENAKRIAYIDDSISQGIRRRATLATNEEILFDGYATSKGVDNPLCF